MWDECNCAVVWAFFGIAFLWDWNESELFQSCGRCWVFQICWHIECSTFTASSFRIWNSSAGIPSLPLALFVVMLPKAHLTSHSRCLALGEWSHHRDYLGHEDLFCIVYCAHLCLKCSLCISNFLEEISSLFHSIVFLYFFALITEEDFLISSYYSLELCIQACIFPFLLCCSLLFKSIMIIQWKWEIDLRA